MASSAVTPAKRAAVPDARRHGHDRCRGEATDDGGERTLHPGDDDHGIGGGQVVAVGEEPVHAGDADVGEPHGVDAVGEQHGGALVGDGQVGGAGAGEHDPLGSRRRRSPHDRGAVPGAAGVGVERGRRPGRRRRGSRAPAPSPPSSSSPTMAATCAGVLARSVDDLGHALAQRPVVVDPGEAEVGPGQAPQAVDGVVGRDVAGVTASSSCRRVVSSTSGAGGIRTHGPLRVDGFQGRCLRPLGHRSTLDRPTRPRLAWPLPRRGAGVWSIGPHC